MELTGAPPGGPGSRAVLAGLLPEGSGEAKTHLCWVPGPPLSPGSAGVRRGGLPQALGTGPEVTGAVSTGPCPAHATVPFPDRA